MNFHNIDLIFKDKLPKEICYEIYKYSTNICNKCEIKQIQCDTCQLYLCYCNNKEKTLKCHCCKKIICNHHIEAIFICGSKKEHWCYDCWHFDDWKRRGVGIEKKVTIDKYDY